ncbi:unnamed protein product, partial [Allacma fusca]
MYGIFCSFVKPEEIQMIMNVIISRIFTPTMNPLEKFKMGSLLKKRSILEVAIICLPCTYLNMAIGGFTIITGDIEAFYLFYSMFPKGYQNGVTMGLAFIFEVWVWMELLVLSYAG